MPEQLSRLDNCERNEGTTTEKEDPGKKPNMTNKLQEVLKQLVAGHEIAYLCLYI